MERMLDLPFITLYDRGWKALVGLHAKRQDRTEQQEADAPEEWQVPVSRFVDYVAEDQRGNDGG